MAETPGGEILLCQRDIGESVIEVRLDSDTVWLSRQQIADLNQTSRINIVEHIRHVSAPSDVEAAYLESVKRAQREIEGKYL